MKFLPSKDQIVPMAIMALVMIVVVKKVAFLNNL